jgi:hypothetical protein
MRARQLQRLTNRRALTATAHEHGRPHTVLHSQAQGPGCVLPEATATFSAARFTLVLTVRGLRGDPET